MAVHTSVLTAFAVVVLLVGFQAKPLLNSSELKGEEPPNHWLMRMRLPKTSSSELWRRFVRPPSYKSNPCRFSLCSGRKRWLRGIIHSKLFVTESNYNGLFPLFLLCSASIISDSGGNLRHFQVLHLTPLFSNLSFSKWQLPSWHPANPSKNLSGGRKQNKIRDPSLKVAGSRNQSPLQTLQQTNN